ncbi:MAG: molecular chaperone SurA, partial [Comamonadaceae bacterium]
MMRSQFSLRQLSGRALLLVLCAQAASPVWAAQAQSTQKPAARGAAATSAPAEQFVDGIAAIVDKDVITLRELAGATNQARRELQTQKIQVPPDDVLQKQVLQRLIMERVQRHEAERMGIKIDDAQIDRAIATIAQRNKLSPQQVRAEVEKSGTTWADYRRSLSDEIRLDRMRQRAVDNSIVISDAEVDAFLKEQERRGNSGIRS